MVYGEKPAFVDALATVEAFAKRTIGQGRDEA